MKTHANHAKIQDFYKVQHALLNAVVVLLEILKQDHANHVMQHVQHVMVDQQTIVIVVKLDISFKEILV